MSNFCYDRNRKAAAASPPQGIELGKLGMNPSTQNNTNNNRPPDHPSVPSDESKHNQPLDHPPVPSDESKRNPDKVPEKTFANSNYKRFYIEGASAPFGHKLLNSVQETVTLVARRFNHKRDPDTVEDDVFFYMKKLQEDAFRHHKALKSDVNAAAEYLWTSAKKHPVVNNMEFCSILNAVIRADIAEEIQAATPIFRSLNALRVHRTDIGHSLTKQSHPDKSETWRGGGFRDECKAFFVMTKGTKKKKYRVPGFLATSESKTTASGFAYKAGRNHPCALWHFKFDRRGKTRFEYRVRHMSFVSNTLIPGEGEYLFSPYSVFTLLSVKWSSHPRTPHEFTILPAIDNQDEDENLPLAPWY